MIIPFVSLQKTLLFVVVKLYHKFWLSSDFSSFKEYQAPKKSIPDTKHIG